MQRQPRPRGVVGEMADEGGAYAESWNQRVLRLNIGALGIPYILKTIPSLWETRETWPFEQHISISRETKRGARMSTGENSNWKTRLVEDGFPDRSFDIEFWQGQGDDAIFAAAWELVVLAEEVKHGRTPTLQRTVTNLKRV